MMGSTSTSIAVKAPRRAAKQPTWLHSRRGKLVLATVAGIAALAARGYWLGFAAIAPLLFLLPCAAMMLHCMKGMGNGDRQRSKKDLVQAQNGDNQRRQA